MLNRLANSHCLLSPSPRTPAKRSESSSHAESRLGAGRSQPHAPIGVFPTEAVWLGRRELRLRTRGAKRATNMSHHIVTRSRVTIARPVAAAPALPAPTPPDRARSFWRD